MTLIATVIASYGILQASDSNLTTDSTAAGAGQKVFELGSLNAALAVAGAYSVGGQSMDGWMPASIQAYASTSQPTLEGFASYLGERLSSELTEQERNKGSLIHIAGYVEQHGVAHPEFFFVRNIANIDPRTGAYEGIKDQFDVTEDFWNRDYLDETTRQTMASGSFYHYFNGYPPGRIAYLGLSRMLQEFLEQVWRHPDWKFRRPRCLDELAPVVDVEFRAIGALFSSSDYPVPYVGGEAQIARVYPPPSFGWTRLRPT